MSRTVLFVANRGYALASSRTALIQRFIESGWRVVLVTADDADSRALCQLGAELEEVVFDRGGVSPMADLRAMRRLFSICRTRQPELIQQFHAKPVIFGTLAARAALGRSVHIVNTITGLGQAFVRGGTGTRIAGLGYALAMRRADVAVFQNSDDRALFLGRRWLRSERAVLIPGSGVDVRHFSFEVRSALGDRSPVVVMLGRLLAQKGVAEFAAVAGRIRERWSGARFVLAGEDEVGHPDRIAPETLVRSGDVEYVGHMGDVRPLLAEADLMLFPSHREGVPRAVLEAAATGLPTVGFDVPGVREAVRSEETGYLVPFRDVEALIRRVDELLRADQVRIGIGVAARRFMETAFDIHAIEREYLEVYRRLITEPDSREVNVYREDD